MNHDDEVTTDVDPEWIAAIRAETATGSPAPTPPAPTPPEQDAATETSDDPGNPDPVGRAGEDWFDTELKWDAEATVGVSAGLIDRIRSEIDTDRAQDASVPPAPPLVPPPATGNPAIAVTSAPNATTPAPPPSAPPAPPAPSASPAPVVVPPTPAPAASAVPITTGEEATSTTVRWEPRQRLAMTAPVKESAAIVDDSRHTGLDRTKVAIAVIVAVTVLLVVWLVSRSGGSDDPAPAGTVPAASTPITPSPADGSGGGG